MSSQCAPKQSTRKAAPAGLPRLKLSMDMGLRLQAGDGLAYALGDDFLLRPLHLPRRRRSRRSILLPVFPQFPGGFAPRVQFLELLPILERIHASPVTVI